MIDDGFLFADFRYTICHKVVCFPDCFAFVVVVVAVAVVVAAVAVFVVAVGATAVVFVAVVPPDVDDE